MSEREEESLWDPSAPKDPEVARLEGLLARYRYKPEPLRAPAPAPRPFTRFVPWIAALAASVALFLGLRAWLVEPLPSSYTAAYEVTGVPGVLHAGPGQAIETRESGGVVRIADIGDVLVGPHSRLRVDDCGERVHALFLARGAITARITAEPRRFQVGTPAGLTIDLGCLYELDVDASDDARVHVLTGRISFESGGRRVVVPAGAHCMSTPARGPDTPVWDDAPAEFIELVRALEFASDPEPALVEQLADADVREQSLSLWHLYRWSASSFVRAKLYAVLERVYPQPSEFTRDAILERRPEALDAWGEMVAERDWIRFAGSGESVK